MIVLDTVTVSNTVNVGNRHRFGVGRVLTRSLVNHYIPLQHTDTLTRSIKLDELIFYNPSLWFQLYTCKLLTLGFLEPARKLKKSF